jgi:hypothetical protein
LDLGEPAKQSVLVAVFQWYTVVVDDGVGPDQVYPAHSPNLEGTNNQRHKEGGSVAVWLGTSALPARAVCCLPGCLQAGRGDEGQERAKDGQYQYTDLFRVLIQRRRSPHGTANNRPRSTKQAPWSPSSDPQQADYKGRSCEAEKNQELRLLVARPLYYDMAQQPLTCATLGLDAPLRSSSWGRPGSSVQCRV